VAATADQLAVTDVDVLARAAELAAARQPFAIATVVWRRPPASGHVGSRVLIHPDGSAEGWLGGACAGPTVVDEARAAMQAGEPRLLFLGGTDELVARAQQGMVTVPMACDSEGALEVFVEPVLPSPHLVVIGRSPGAEAMAAIGLAVGWTVDVVDDGGRADDHARPELVSTTLDLDALHVGPASAVVIATQGHYDDLAVEAALATDAGYIGLVASEKRAASMLEMLRGRNIDETALSRVVAPAGLDLGPVGNAEIAVAVLADLVRRRAHGQLSAVTVPSTPPAARTLDPVCTMVVDPAASKYRSDHAGATVHFCAPGCKAAFDAEPSRYLDL